MKNEFVLNILKLVRQSKFFQGGLSHVYLLKNLKIINIMYIK